MAKRRNSIVMSEDEIRDHLAGRNSLNVATFNPDGRIHLVAMWYGFIDEQIAFWTYAKSQKVLNLRRDPRMTCLVETGESYDQLRGVELVGRGVIDEDRSVVQAVGESVFERYTAPLDDNTRQVVANMGAKRLVVRVEVDKIVSWDHSKLGGGY